jgi:heme/copper-type cytochrome/quinol oxidase subunit 3
MNEPSLVMRQPLPIGSIGRHASGWYGTWALIATEASLFAYLLFSYFYLAGRATGAWPPEGLPSLRLALPNTAVLIASSVVLAWGERGVRQGNRTRLMLGLAGALILGAVFVVVQVMEWGNKSFGLATDAYGSLYFTTTGFHIAHVVGGLLALAVLLVWAGLGYFGRERHAAVSIGAIYWHFVDVVWLAVFTTFYVVPYLGSGG